MGHCVPPSGWRARTCFAHKNPVCSARITSACGTCTLLWSIYHTPPLLHKWQKPYKGIFMPSASLGFSCFFLSFFLNLNLTLNLLFPSLLAAQIKNSNKVFYRAFATYPPHVWRFAVFFSFGHLSRHTCATPSVLFRPHARPLSSPQARLKCLLDAFLLTLRRFSVTPNATSLIASRLAFLPTCPKKQIGRARRFFLFRLFPKKSLFRLS